LPAGSRVATDPWPEAPPASRLTRIVEVVEGGGGGRAYDLGRGGTSTTSSTPRSGRPDPMSDSQHSDGWGVLHPLAVLLATVTLIGIPILLIYFLSRAVAKVFTRDEREARMAAGWGTGLACLALIIAAIPILGNLARSATSDESTGHMFGSIGLVILGCIALGVVASALIAAFSSSLSKEFAERPATSIVAAAHEQQAHGVTDGPEDDPEPEWPEDETRPWSGVSISVRGVPSVRSVLSVRSVP
jgi:hypothetical protein